MDELAGKKIGRLATSSMAGWKTAVGEATARGFTTQDFFRRIQSFPDNEEMINALINGDISVAILQGCHYERLPVGLREQLKPLEPREFTETRCLSTSELYPAWSLLASPKVPEQMQMKVLGTLKNERALSEFGEWTAPAPLRDVYALLKRSGDELIDEFEPETWTDLLWKMRYPTLFVLLILFGLFIHDRLVVKEVAKQTALLKEGLRKQWAIEKKMETWERASIVSIMSSMVAHELKQPLGAAAAYCFALRRRMESGEVSAEMMEKGIERVDHQIQRASEVVNQVRSYAKGQRQRLTVDVGKTAEKILLDISASAPDTDLEFRKDSEELFVEANPIELEIILINLVKNAIEVVKDKSNGRVVVTLSAEGNTVCIKVEDNGEKLSDAEWKQISQLAMATTKHSGLGFGLSIVAGLAEDLGGRITFERIPSGGLSVFVRLPLAKEKS